MQPGSDCYFHPNEHAQPTDFKQCFECGHSYRTEQELIDEYVRGRSADMAHLPIPTTANIFFCPTCDHDF